MNIKSSKTLSFLLITILVLSTVTPLTGLLPTSVEASVTQWHDPDSTNDPDSAWSNDGNTIDGDTGTKATCTVAGGEGTWGSFLEAHLDTGVWAEAIQVYCSRDSDYINKYDIDVEIDGSWVNVAIGTTFDSTTSFQMSEVGTVDKVRIRLYNSDDGGLFGSGDPHTGHCHLIQVGESTVALPTNDQTDTENMTAGLSGWYNVTVTDTNGGYDTMANVTAEITTPDSPNEGFTVTWNYSEGSEDWSLSEPPVSTEEWKDGFDHRKYINITGASGAGTGYPILIEIGNEDWYDGSVVNWDAPEPFSVGISGAQSDFGDVIFTDDDGTTELDYYQIGYDSDRFTNFLVWVDDNLDNNQTIWVYWGTSETSTTNSTTSRFIDYNDFEDGDTEGWLNIGGTVSSSSPLDGSYSWYSDAYDNSEVHWVWNDTDLGTGYAIGAHMEKLNDVGTTMGPFGLWNNNTSNEDCYFGGLRPCSSSSDSYQMYKLKDGSVNASGSEIVWNELYGGWDCSGLFYTEVRIGSSKKSMRLCRDQMRNEDWFDASTVTDDEFTSGRYGIRINNMNAKIDNIYIRDWMEDGPSVSGFSSYTWDSPYHAIVTLNNASCTRVNVDSDTDKYCFSLTFNPSTEGWANVTVTSKDETLQTDVDTYTNEFYLFANTLPTNDACNSDTSFDVDVDGWVNVTVTDADGGYDMLNTVDIQVTTASSETFTLRWTQSTDAFTEESDADNICTLDASDSTRENVDSDTDKYCFNFQINAVPSKSACDVQVTTTDRSSYTDTDTYSSEFSINFYLSLTVEDGSHSWSGLSPGDTDQQVGGDGDIDLTIDANNNFDIQVKSDGDLSDGDGHTIPDGNIKVHKDTLGSAVSLTDSYADVGGLTNLERGTSLSKYFTLWITVPDPCPAGTYSYTLSVKALEH